MPLFPPDKKQEGKAKSGSITVSGSIKWCKSFGKKF
jgi:hypothetical protein